MGKHCFAVFYCQINALYSRRDGLEENITVWRKNFLILCSVALLMDCFVRDLIEMNTTV